MSNTIRELQPNEVSKIRGGVLPVIAAMGSFVGHSAVRSVGKYYFSRAMTSYAIYSAAESVGDLSDN